MGFWQLAIVQLPKQKRSVKQPLFLIGTCLLFIGLIWFGSANENKAQSALIMLQVGQEYLVEEKYEQAYPYLIDAVEGDPTLPEATFLLAYAEAMLENYEQAKELLLTTIHNRDDFHEAYYNLTLVYLELGQVEEAKETIEKAVGLERVEEYLDLRSELLDQ